MGNTYNIVEHKNRWYRESNNITIPSDGSTPSNLAMSADANTLVIVAYNDNTAADSSVYIYG